MENAVRVKEHRLRSSRGYVLAQIIVINIVVGATSRKPCQLQAYGPNLDYIPCISFQAQTTWLDFGYVERAKLRSRMEVFAVEFQAGHPKQITQGVKNTDVQTCRRISLSV